MQAARGASLNDADTSEGPGNGDAVDPRRATRFKLVFAAVAAAAYATDLVTKHECAETCPDSDCPGGTPTGSIPTVDSTPRSPEDK